MKLCVKCQQFSVVLEGQHCVEHATIEELRQAVYRHTDIVIDFVDSLKAIHHLQTHGSGGMGGGLYAMSAYKLRRGWRRIAPWLGEEPEAPEFDLRRRS